MFVRLLEERGVVRAEENWRSGFGSSPWRPAHL